MSPMKQKYFNLYYLYYFVDTYTTKELILEWKPEMGIEAMDNIQMPEFELSEYSADECPKDTGKYATGIIRLTIFGTADCCTTVIVQPFVNNIK